MTRRNAEYEEARKRVHELRSFYKDLVFYALINIVLVVINLVTNPDQLWFYWVTIFWGIGILLHSASVFLGKGKFLGKEWEEKKIRKIMSGSGEGEDETPDKQA